MRKVSFGKRLLSMLLALVMVFGILPTSLWAREARAEDTILDAAIFVSDIHGNDGDFTDVMGGVATSGVDYSAVGFVGDTCLTVSNATSIAQTALGDTSLKAMFSYAASHDKENSADISTNWDYSGEVEDISDYYLVYTIRETDMETASAASTAAPNFTSWYNGLSDAQKKLPIFIMSHRPMHERRSDNKGAATWYTAISAAAETSDIVFLWGHNHTGESSADTNAYYVAKNGSETISIQGGSTVTPNFTYMTAGYVNANGQNPSRKYVATTVRIYADRLEFVDYGTSGEYTGSYSHTGVEVDRKFASVEEETVIEPTTLTVEGITTDYFVGDTLDAPTSVTVTYSDDTTKSLSELGDSAVLTAVLTDSEGNAVTNYTFAEAGTYTLYYQLIIGEWTGTTKEKPTTITVHEEVDGWVALSLDVDSTTVYTVEDDLTFTKIVLIYQNAKNEICQKELKISECQVTLVNALTDASVDADTAMSTVGQYKATVSYTLNDKTVSAVEYFDVCASGTLSDSTTGVKVDVSSAVIKEISVSVSTNTNVAGAVSSRLNAYKAYDITPTTGGLNAGNYATVSLPVDPSWDTSRIEAYYVSDDGKTLERMDGKYVDGYYVFRVSHFSTYVVGEGDGQESDATVPGSSTTTTENKTVYVKVDTPVNGEQYLIVSTGVAGTAGYILGGSSVTPVNGTLTVNGTDGTYTYIESAGTLWTASGSGSSWSFANGSNYLGYTQSSSGNGYIGGLTYSYAVNTAASSTTWTMNDSQLYIYLESSTAGSIFGGSDSSANYYLTGGSSWSMSTSSANVYFYKPVTVTISTTTGIPDTTYHMDLTVDGNAVSNHAYTVNGVVSGTAVQMNAIYTATANGTSTTVDAPAGGSYTVLSSSNEAVATIGTDGVLTFTGVEGETLVQVEYTWTVDGVEYKTQNYVVITAKTPVYNMSITDPESTQIKIGATSDLEAVVTVDGIATTGEITWTSSDKSIATVDDNGVVTGVAVGDVTITATYTDPNGTVHTDSVDISVVDAVYTLDITLGGNVVTGTTVTKKDITSSTTLQLGTKVYADGTEVSIPANATIEWHIPEEYHNIATVDHDTGLLTLKGVDGAFYVTATLTVNGKDYTVGVNFSVTTSSYSIPSDGTSDFPEYPNEGSVRFDKVATAVGNFSQTGITQVELSMTGVPYTTGSEIDVVLMLDMTGSMSDNGMEAAELATIAFMEKIVKNEDGTYNENRIAVYAFNSGDSSPYELVSLKKITSDSELATATTAIKTASDKQTSGGTPFDEAAQKCQSVLAAAKTDGTGNNRQQFCVFMSDGGPTTYEGSDGYTYYGGNASGDRKITSYIGGYSSSSSSSWTYNLPTEYYTDAMKADGVTVYTVGLLLQTAPSNPSPYSSMTDSTYDSTTDSLTSIGSHYYFTSTILKNMASDESKYIDIFDVDNADKATAAFESIAMSILQAATDVKVEDKISDNYTMIFDIPEGSKDITGVTNDFYIEFLEYALDENHERTTSTSLTKLYLGKSNGSYFAASDANGTAYAAPVFENVTLGDKGTIYYWTTDSTYAGSAGASYSDGTTTYYFVPAGIKATDDDYDATKWFNMTSGAYASGTINETTNMSENLVIATPYFVYNAGTRMLYWTVEKIATTEYVLRYFLYLDDSATEIGTENEVPSGPYETNDWANMTYTNFNGNDCKQEFPVPQMTWNGAQVSYVFYLVNAAGQPINKSGQIVDFANATFITDVYTHTVVWNGTDAVEELNVEYLANNLLPDAYKIYDESAEYTIHVYQDHTGATVFDYFIIEGSTLGTVNPENGNTVNNVTTTKVYNTKAGTKYADYGIYSASAVGTNFTTTDANGNTVTITTTKQADLDYSDTTVAFAVVWEPKLVEDTVVVDFGLDVLINVVQNDNLQNTVSGIGVGKDAYGDTEMNTGVVTDSKLGTAALTVDGHTISIENENAIRFHQNNMTFTKPVTFYYESPVEFYEGSNKQTGYMYSSVTVIPATTIYYEDSFLTLESYTVTKNDDGTSTSTKDETSKWTADGTVVNETQDQDRPGKSQISADLDADNKYGYDSAYENMATHSMGSAAMINVDASTRGEATFTFYGTGFDVISLTSNASGTLIVQLYSGDSATGTAVKSLVVDTFYGYTQNDDGDWVVSVNDPNALYQVPVMKMSGLTYGQYTVKIIAGYNSYFDNVDGSSDYDLYLDAIRIYDPTGNLNTDANNAYKEDGEGWPQFIELRNNIIAASNYTVTENEDGTVTVSGTNLSGAIFIDSNDATTSIADYVSYGPNNELYLAAGQSVSFALDQTYASIIADVQIAMKLGNGTSATYEIYNAASDGTKSNTITGTLKTATDLYYSIKDLASGTIVISNTSGGILSITNIKVTYTQNPYGTSTSSEEDLDSGVMTTSLYVDEEVATAAVMSLRSMPAYEPEETVPEETEPETTVPEETEPEETEPEETIPGETEPEEDSDPSGSEIGEIIAELIGKLIGKLFGWLFG